MSNSEIRRIASSEMNHHFKNNISLHNIIVAQLYFNYFIGLNKVYKKFFLVKIFNHLTNCKLLYRMDIHVDACNVNQQQK